MPRSVSLKNYFELLPRDLTGDYIRQVICCQSTVLKVMRLNMHLYRKYEWFVDQSRQLLQNGRGSKKAKFRIGTAYDRVIGSHCVNPYMTCQRLIHLQK